MASILLFPSFPSFPSLEKQSSSRFLKSTCLIFTLVFLGEIHGASLWCESWFLSVYVQGSMGRFSRKLCMPSWNPQEIPMKSIKLMPSEDMRSCIFSLEVDGYTTWPPRRRSEDHTIQTAKEEMPLSVWYRTLDEIILSYNIYYLIYWYLLGNMNDGILQSAK